MAHTAANRIEPAPGQESVWDYPRPPALEDSNRHIVIQLGGETIVDTRRAKRVLETSHPPVYYVPPEDIRDGVLRRTSRRTFCEWKGEAHYYTVSAGNRSETDAAWAYADPTPGFAAAANYVAFYPSRMDRCFVDGEEVRSQAGDFYGGWITDDVVGPFKGDPSTIGW